MLWRVTKEVKSIYLAYAAQRVYEVTYAPS